MVGMDVSGTCDCVRERWNELPSTRVLTSLTSCPEYGVVVKHKPFLVFCHTITSLPTLSIHPYVHPHIHTSLPSLYDTQDTSRVLNTQPPY